MLCGNSIQQNMSITFDNLGTFKYCKVENCTKCRLFMNYFIKDSRLGPEKSCLNVEQQVGGFYRVAYVQSDGFEDRVLMRVCI